MTSKLFACCVCAAMSVTMASAQNMTDEQVASEMKPVETNLWRVSIGAALNARVRTHLHTPRLTVESYLPREGTMGSSAALSHAEAHEYDGDGFVKPDAENDGRFTSNWQLPISSYDTAANTFYLCNAYEDVLSSTVSQTGGDNAHDDYQPGVSVELSRELWASEKRNWGVDFAAAVSYFFGNDLYRASARATRRTNLDRGRYETEIYGRYAMEDYQDGTLEPATPNFYGEAAYERSGAPALFWPDVGDPIKRSHLVTVSSGRGYHAEGDYYDLEMMFLARPWYEICDGWRVFGELGVGVSYARFEYDIAYSDGPRRGQNFDDWSVYGLAGLGTVVTWKDVSLSCDFIARLGSEDLNVNGRDIHGSIDRGDWLFRVMLGYSF